MPGVGYLVDSVVGNVEDFEGNKYNLKDSPFIPEFTNFSKTIQAISVTESFKKGQVWEVPFSMENDDIWFKTDKGTILKTRRFILNKITYKDENILELEFIENYKTIMKLKEHLVKEEAAFKELVMELNLSKDKLQNLIKTMLMNTFLPETLEKMLKEDKLDFIMDNLWIYLKAEGKAYRV